MADTSKETLLRSRTDVVGSLLRPASLKQAYADSDAGKIPPDELQRIENEAIRAAVRLQEQTGLDVITDGEYRRLNFQDSFGASVSGFEARRLDLIRRRARARGQTSAALGPVSYFRRGCGDLAAPAGGAEASAGAQPTVGGVPIRQRAIHEARQDHTHRPGPYRPALRLSEFQVGLLEHR